MRIHRLNFQAIGPYPGQQNLAFDQLETAGLFLLDGPTGAGKSTILDVITFALYGKADDERKHIELHSTLATPGTPPTIELDVSFGTRRFVIDRVLQHMAPRRGAKTADDVVTRQASIVLTEIVEGQAKQLTTRVDEAQQILRSVIGLSREQFTSVVLLPQGEFARFLKASSNEREAILRQLFNTHRFDQIGDYLSQQAKQLRGSVESDSQRRQSLRSDLIETAKHYVQDPAVDDAETEHDELDTLDDDQLIEHVETGMRQRQEQVTARVQHATSQVETSRKRLTELQEHQLQVREATDYRQRRAAHQDQAEAVRAAETQLADHARAKPVVEAQSHVETAHRQLVQAVETWKHHLDMAQDDAVVKQWVTRMAGDQQLFIVDLDDVDALCDGWKSVESAAIRALEHVEQHEKTQSAITAAHKRKTQWETTRTQLTSTLTEIEGSMRDKTEQIEQHKARAEQLAGVEATLHTAKQRLEEATTQQKAAQQADVAYQHTEQARRHRDTAKASAETAVEDAQQLLRRRIDAAAGFLAQQLETGEPCAVCGATSHPMPAELPDGEEISNAAVQRAEHEATQARREANTAEQQYQTRLAELHTLQTRAGGLSITEANDAFAQRQSDVTTAQQHVTELAELREQIQQHQTQVDRLGEQKVTAQQQLTEANTQIATITDELQQRQAELDQALGDFSSVDQLRAATEPAHRLVTQIVAQGNAVSTAVTGHSTATKRLAEALRDSATKDQEAFADAEVARSCMLDEQKHAEFESQVRRWTTEHDRLKEKSGQSAVVAGLTLLDDGVQAPSEEQLVAAREAQQSAQQRLDQANRDQGSFEATHQQSRTQQHQLHELSKRSAQQLAVYEELVGLSDVVAGRGENDKGMPLRSFVLAGWLEQVAANASERLTGMTGGRYELQHSVGQGGRGLAGLNLEVIDHLNDTVRNPSTLSGGETFMASLALALGLADAVQAQAGGVSLDTLFIDEGFGSLDAETLEDVMGVLDTLQDDGRLIGLVSHVESMKQQIPYRIQVHKTQTGSHVQITGPDLP